MKRLHWIYQIALCVVLLGSCKKDTEFSPETNNKKAINQYADIVYAGYEDSYNTALTLQQKVNTFVNSPSEANFNACKQAWLDARTPYGQTEAFRFYGGPIDGDDGLEGYINAWPMDENFIDYVQGQPNAGLINDAANYPQITKQTLLDLNESISETSIFTGYHAIEFLLWGQDTYANSAGLRPWTDFKTGAGATAQNQSRRREYLKVVTDLLVEHLGEVKNAWAIGAVYREDFTKNTDYKEILGRIFTGIGELSKGELAGERMFVAVDSQDQENEHSCFSDNTHNDIKTNFLGIKNVFLGSYTRTDGSVVKGTSFYEIAKAMDKEKAEKAKEALDKAETAINAIPTPFDQAIINNSQLVLDAVTALRDLSDRLTDVGFSLGAKL